MTNMITLDMILNNTDIEACDTIHLAGRDISIAQKPHIEADARRASAVLVRLASMNTAVETSINPSETSLIVATVDC